MTAVEIRKSGPFENALRRFKKRREKALKRTGLSLR